MTDDVTVIITIHAITNSEKLIVKNFFVFLLIAIPLFVSLFDLTNSPILD